MTSSLIKVVGPYQIAVDGVITPLNRIRPYRPLRGIESYPEDPVETTPSGLLRFKSYQRRAVSYIMEALQSFGLADLGFAGNGCAYYAMPGAGKTLTTMQACSRMGLLQQPGIVLGPLQAQKTWCGPDSDPTKHFGLVIQPFDLVMLRQGSVSPTGASAPWVFVHYEILDEARVDVGKLLSQIGAVTLICDEAHYLSNPQAARTSASRSRSSDASIRYRIELTATPLRASRANLWSQLDIMQPGQWGTAHEFSVEYLGLQQQRTRGGQVYWEPTGPTNTEDLRRRLSGFTLKVSRGTAAAYGGVRIKRTPLRIALSGDERGELQEAILAAGRQAAAGRKAKAPKKIKVKVGSAKFKVGGEKVSKGKYPEKLVALTHAISAMAAVKTRHAARAALDMAKRHPYSIVFTERRASAKSIAQELRATAPEGLTILGPVDGAMPVDRRWAICESVSDTPHAILIATAASIGVSNHSLRVATACLIVTPFWNPDANLQVEGRLLSEGDDVEEKEAIYLLLEDNPVDVRILERIVAKERDTADILGLGPNEAVGGDLTGGPVVEDMDAGALWDAISAKLDLADHPPAPTDAAAPEPEPESESESAAEPEPKSLALLYLEHVVPAKAWATLNPPAAALAILEQQDDDQPVALTRHPELGWAVISENGEAPYVVWSENR